MSRYATQSLYGSAEPTPPQSRPLILSQDLLAHYRQIALFAKEHEDRRQKLQQDLWRLLDAGATIEPGRLRLTAKLREPEVLLEAVCCEGDTWLF